MFSDISKSSITSKRMYGDGIDRFGGKNEFQENKHLLSIKIK